MDNVESGYYLSLDSCPEMYRKKDNNTNYNQIQQKELISREQNTNEMEQDRGSNESEDTENFIDSMTKIYSLNKGKSKIYKEFFNLYSENQEGSSFEVQSSPLRHSISSESDKSFSLKNKLFLWLLIIILLSNPILGSYNLYHFHNYKHFILSKFHNFHNFNNNNNSNINNNNNNNSNMSNINNNNKDYKDKYSGDVDDYPYNTDNNYDINDYNYLNDKNNLKDEDIKELILNLSNRMSRFIVKYSFIEIFGELIFGLFSLLLLSLCKLPCNNKNSIRFMMPTLFMFYMIIYRFLAFYILWSTIKILIIFILILSIEYNYNKLFNFIITFTPNILMGLKDLFEGLTQYNLNQRQVLLILHKLYQLDRINIYLLIIYCLENVFITFNEFVELFSYFFKLFLAQINRKILRRNELKFYQSAETSGRVRLLKNCFKNDFFQSYDPHEKYVHSLYNYASDIGTYLKNVEIRDYSANLDHLTNKFKNKKFLINNNNDNN